MNLCCNIPYQYVCVCLTKYVILYIGIYTETNNHYYDIQFALLKSSDLENDTRWRVSVLLVRLVNREMRVNYITFSISICNESLIRNFLPTKTSSYDRDRL